MFESKLRSLIRDRRAQLWVCQRYDLLPGQQPHDCDIPAVDAGLRYRLDENEVDIGLASFYWGAIWFEGANSPILRVLRRAEPTESGGRDLVVLASDADARADLSFQDYLAAFVLPGLLDNTVASDAAYGSLGKRARESVAWNLAKRVGDFPGSLLIVIGASEPKDIGLLWEALADIQIRDLTILLAWTGAAADVPPLNNAAVDLLIFHGDATQLLNALQETGAPTAGKRPESVLRVGDRSVSLPIRTTRYILRRFALLNESVFTSPNSLTSSELDSFFDGSLDEWSCFSLGVLPVPRSYRTDIGITLEDDVLKGLRNLASGSTGSRSLVYQLPCAAASGATTLMRSVAYACAREGFPTLIARPEQVEIDIEDILSFVTSLSDSSMQQGVNSLPPILVVLDIEHSELNPTLARQVAQSLATQGRRVMILQALRSEDIRPHLPKRKDQWVLLPVLNSAATDYEVETCWKRFSNISSTWGLIASTQTLEDWQRYKSATKIVGPSGILDSETLFWVAIRFFVCEGTLFLDQESLRDSLSKWITKRTNQIGTESSRRLLQNIAVLSSYRLVSPLTTVLRPITGRSISSNIVKTLRELKDIVDWKDLSEDLDDQILMFRHPSIADEYLHSLGVLSDAQKVEILTPLIEGLSAGSRADRWIAEVVAAKVLAPVESRGVYDWDWRLKAFDKIPTIIAQYSRAILHHWARCLYWSSKDQSLTALDRRKRLEMAIGKLEQALGLERRLGRDEHPGHIANTLGVAYWELAKFHQTEGESDKSSKAWEFACKSFERAITLLPSDNVIAYLAFAFRLLWHARVVPDGPALHTAEATRDVAQALALLDRAEDALSGTAAPDPSWSTDLALYKTKALSYLGDARARAYIEELKSSPTPGLAYYCQARMTLGEQPSQSKVSEAILLLQTATGHGIKVGAESLRLLASIIRMSKEHQYDYAAQIAVYRSLEREVGGNLTDAVDIFRLAVLCYQVGNFAEGAERFRRLREYVRQIQSSYAPQKLADYWRDGVGNPKVTRVRVDKASADWRGEGYVEAINQTVPLRPRHFVPIARPNEYRECLIRFEVWGPLAIPPRLER